MSNEQLIELLKGYREGNLDDAGVRELEGYITNGKYDNEIQQDIKEALEELSIHPLWTKEYAEEIWSKVKGQTIEKPIQPAHRIHFLKTTWPAWRQAGFKYAAAIIILITGTAIYFFTHTSHPETAVVQTVPPVSGNDAAPGSDRATLTLSNGEKVQLNNATSETISDGTLSIKNNNGQLLYTNSERGSLSPAGGGGFAGGETGGGPRETRPATNTMTTPNGGQYKLTLSDGTRVWLNAASSITYPTSFTEKTRTVSITGECYFEVTKNAKQPFKVIVASGTLSPAGGSTAREARREGGPLPAGRQGGEARTAAYTITVLGTSFNVNAYPDENVMKTSLLEGSIKIGDTNIKPGEAYQNGKIQKTNLQQDLAWKNGVFDFNNLTVEQAMRQISRWYNVEVVYTSKIPAIKFFGRINRGAPLSTVLLALNQAGVKFKVENNKLIVE